MCEPEEMCCDPKGHPLYHVEDEGTGREAYSVVDEKHTSFPWFLYEDQVKSIT